MVRPLKKHFFYVCLPLIVWCFCFYTNLIFFFRSTKLSFWRVISQITQLSFITSSSYTYRSLYRHTVSLSLPHPPIPSGLYTDTQSFITSSFYTYRSSYRHSLSLPHPSIPTGLYTDTQSFITSSFYTFRSL